MNLSYTFAYPDTQKLQRLRASTLLSWSLRTFDLDSWIRFRFHFSTSHRCFDQKSRAKKHFALQPFTVYDKFWGSLYFGVHDSLKPNTEAFFSHKISLRNPSFCFYFRIYYLVPHFATWPALLAKTVSTIESIHFIPGKKHR